MDDLLIKYILKEASPEESDQVQQWLAANAANHAHFDKLLAVWQLASYPNPQPATDAQQALQRLKQSLRARETHVKRIGQRVWATAAAVAGIAVMALGAYVWLKPNTDGKELPPAVHPDTALQQPVRIDTMPKVQPVPALPADTIPHVKPHKKKRPAPVVPVQPVHPKKKTPQQPTQPTDTIHLKKKHSVPTQPLQPIRRKHKTAPAKESPIS